MYIKKIKLLNFRNYSKLNFTLTKGINIIYGDNAQGKTNLLESIYVLGVTKSHRNYIDYNLINSFSEYLLIEGNIKIDQFEDKYNIYIDKNKKILKINDNIVKKISDYISNINIIIFYPEDLDIIKGSPQIRRNFINIELSQLHKNYYINLCEYNKILKMRNIYLKKLNKKISSDLNYLDTLTNYLVEKEIQIYKLRKKFINRINEFCGEIYKSITNLDNFHIVYKPNFLIEINNEDIKEEIINEYKSKYDLDIKLCSTTMGPHKDDIEFFLGEKNLKLYGSQGQQRVGVLALKLSEIELFKKYKNTTPILLLDDIFSELDDVKKNNLLRFISKDVQTIITTTDLSNLNERLINNSKLFYIKEGKIEKIKEVKKDE